MTDLQVRDLLPKHFGSFTTCFQAGICHDHEKLLASMSFLPGTVESEQLLTQSEVFQDEILAGPKNPDQPAENVSKSHNHGTKSYSMTSVKWFAKRLILRAYEV